MEQVGILIDYCDLSTNIIESEVAEIMPSDSYYSFIRIIKTQQESDDC